MSPEITKKDYLIVVWNYFQFHAEQRLKTFHFFIIFSTVLLTAYVTILEKLKIPQIGVIIGILIMFFSFIFWRIDKRNRNLIGNALSALEKYESYLFPGKKGEELNPIRIIHNDFLSKKRIYNNITFLSLWSLFRYSKCYNLIFFTIGSLGFLAFSYSLLQVWLN